MPALQRMLGFIKEFRNTSSPEYYGDAPRMPLDWKYGIIVVPLVIGFFAVLIYGLVRLIRFLF